jgi:hypothetical protein
VLSDPDLDELADSLISDKVTIVFPLAWISERWVKFDTASRALRNDPARLEESDPDRTLRAWRPPDTPAQAELQVPDLPG